MALAYTLLLLFIWIINNKTEASLLEQLNFFVNQNRYVMQPSTFQTKLSLDAVMSVSLELGFSSCQEGFKWERWNCPSDDFFRRHSTNHKRIDREDAYVEAVVTAAALYTIAKDCSSGMLSGCASDNENSKATATCSDDPENAAKMYKRINQQNFGRDFRGLIAQHNFKAILTLLKQSLVRQCGCPMKDCSHENCVTVLRPFAEISRDIKAMYDEAIQLTAATNARIMWSNIPLDSLVYVAESPNYCDLDAVPHWPGMHGRRCLQATTEEEKGDASSCSNLCHECGYHVRSLNAVTEQSCNCKFTWSFQVQCERCMNVEQQFYCY